MTPIRLSSTVLDELIHKIEVSLETPDHWEHGVCPAMLNALLLKLRALRRGVRRAAVIPFTEVEAKYAAGELDNAAQIAEDNVDFERDEARSWAAIARCFRKAAREIRR